MNNDLIITSGGMSLGDEDHIKKIIEKNGTMHAWRLAIKPGRPVGFGLYNNCPIQCYETWSLIQVSIQITFFCTNLDILRV